MGRQYTEEEVQGLVSYIQQVSIVKVDRFEAFALIAPPNSAHCIVHVHPPLFQLESNLSKKDEVIAAKDRRIAALEAVQSPTPSSSHKPTLQQYVQQTVETGLKDDEGVANEVSDESCDVQSESSFGSLGLSFLRNDMSQDENSSAVEESDGRWNIPFDDENEETLMPKSSVVELRHTTALSDIGFRPVTESSSEVSKLVDGLAGMQVTSPIKPVAVRGGNLPFRPGFSPILQTARRGLLTRIDSNGSEKENVDPVFKRLSADKCTLSGELSSPCR